MTIIQIITIHHHHSEHEHSHGHDHQDLNQKAAFIHVVADAATSVLAIIALFAGKYFGWNFLDAVLGIIGAILVAKWSWGLIRQTGKFF
jgi:Co/Zn/Cd efflux system component